VYAIIADYRNGHQRILPREYFTSLDVERGGVGAGTVIRFEMKMLGKTRTYRASITEPSPGRVLVETNDDASGGGAVSTFTVDPEDDGRASRVTIDTEIRSLRSPLGLIERLIATRLLRRIYTRELALLAQVAREGESPSNK
jgi:hypothetical protein